MSTSESESLLVAIARLELLQGLQPDQPAIERRREAYRSFGNEDTPWRERAQMAYSSMISIDGFVASVGDQLLAELDIRANAQLYSAVGGFEISEIVHGLGLWWSPSATWFESGRRLIDSAGLGDPGGEDFFVAADLLLAVSATKLAEFFSTVVSGGQRFLGAGGGRLVNRFDQTEAAFILETLRLRGLMFRDGPNANGRYLGDEVTVEQLTIDANDATASESRERPTAAGAGAGAGDP